MIRIQIFNFIIWKFLQMSKLLCNVLKISGRQMPQMPPLVACLTHNAAMFSSKRETFALQVAYAWVEELFSKWGGTSASQKN